jgi:curved DNA-binding protein CbpA
VGRSKDLYGLLELSRGASREDVRKAYRRLVREYHPDTNPGDDSAEERFKEFQHAYEVLSNLRKRREYDEVLLRASADLVPKLGEFRTNPRVNLRKACGIVLALFLIVDGFLFYRYGQQDNTAPQPPTTASRSHSIATSDEDGEGRPAETQAEENDTHPYAIDHEQQDSSAYLRVTEPVDTEDLRPPLFSSTASANYPTPVIAEEELTILLPTSVTAADYYSLDPLYEDGYYLPEPLYEDGYYLPEPLYEDGYYLPEPLYEGEIDHE